MISLPAAASLSAISFPTCPVWAGSHSTTTVLFFASTINAFVHFIVVFFFCFQFLDLLYGQAAFHEQNAAARTDQVSGAPIQLVQLGYRSADHHIK